MSIDLSNADYRVELTGELPSSSLSSISLVITEDNVDASFWSTVVNGGGNIRATSDYEGINQIPLEVVRCDTSTQEFIIWIKKSSYSSSDNRITLFTLKDKEATQPIVSDTYGRNSVWSDYVASLHLEESSGLTAIDSAGKRDGIYSGLLPNQGVDFGQELSGIDSSNSDTISLGDSQIGVSGGFTHSIKIKPSTNQLQQIITCDRSGGGVRAWQWRLESSGFMRIIVWDTTNTIIINTAGSIPTSANGTYWVSFSWDGSSYKTYINGVLDLNISNTSTPIDAASGGPVLIGSRLQHNLTQYDNTFAGQVGNAQILTGDFRSDDFQSTESSNRLTPNTFWSTGTSDDPSVSGGVSSDVFTSISKVSIGSSVSITTPKPISEISYSIDEPVFSSSLSTTLPQPNSTASFVIDKIGIESTSSVTLPSTQSTIDFSEKGLVFDSSVSLSLPSVSSDIGFTINDNTFSSDVDITLPSPESSVGFSINKPLIDSSLSVTTPIDIIISDVSFSIKDLGFTASTTVTTPKPISNVSFEVESQLFNSSIVTSTPKPISDINFNISKLELDSDVSITSPIPVSDISFTLSEPTFNAVCVVNGLVLSYLPDAITKVRYSNNITKVIVGNNITMIR